MRAIVITTACFFLLASASPQQGKPKASAVPSGKVVLEAYVSAWNHHDLAALDKVLTPDAVHEDIALSSRHEAWREADQKQAPAPTNPPPAHEMQRLNNRLAGRWSIGQAFEPRGGMPKGAVGQGTEVWRPGPGALSLIEEIQTRVGDREFSGLGVIWWDTQAQGYRVVWCGSANPRGCVVMSKLAHWESDQFVVGDEFERDGRKVVYREVFSDFTPDSFTQTIYEGESGGELKRKLTIHATKVSESSKTSAANATPPDDDLSTAKQQVPALDWRCLVARRFPLLGPAEASPPLRTCICAGLARRCERNTFRACLVPR